MIILKRKKKNQVHHLCSLIVSSFLDKVLKRGMHAACCGGGPYRGDNSCGGKRGIEEYELCNNVNNNVFFDSLHPTEIAAEHFAKLMWSRNGDVNEPYNLKELFHYF